jgi:hypothetical protein
MARIGDFLFMGNIIDTDTNDRPYRIRWSQFNNPQGNWVADVGTQSGSVDMPQEFGVVMGITGGKTGLIFQRNGLSRIGYTGGAAVFAKQEVDTQRGLAATFSLAQVGERVYYLSDDGFFVTDGTAGQPISRGKIWQWWLDNANQTYTGQVQAAVDWPNRCVMWTVPSGNNLSSGLVIYNWETESWGYSDLVVDTVMSSGQDGVTLESLDSDYPSIDAMDITLDSAEFLPRGRNLAAFIDGGFFQLTGATLRASFTTGEFQIVPGRKTFVREVTPIITNEAENTRVSVLGRDRQTQQFTGQADIIVGPLGFAPFNFDARYFRVSMSVPAGVEWRDAFGFQMDHDVSGQT